MKPNEPGLQALNDAEVARRALKLLAERRLVPTPETFADAFQECAGNDPCSHGANGALKDLTADLVRQSRMSAQEAAQVMQAAQRHRWSAVRDAVDRVIARRLGGQADAWPSLLMLLLRQADALHPSWTRARKLDAIGRVIETAGGDPALALERLSRLADSWGPAQASMSSAPPGPDAPSARGERSLEQALAAATARAESWQQVAMCSLQVLEHSCQPGAPAQDTLRATLAQAKDAGADAAVRLGPRLIDAVAGIDREIVEEQRIRAGLQRLLALLCDNVGQLAPDEAWLAGQLEPIRALLAGPVRSAQIAAAETRLANLIAQQTTARRGLKEAKIALTEMLATLIDQIGAMGTSAERFTDRVGAYQKELAGSPDLVTLSRIVHGLLTETQTVRSQIGASRAELAEARKKVETYEARVSELEHQLSEVSTLVQKDPLTNALNRRGLSEAFRVECARASRYETPLTLAILDLDDFKAVNDTLGHVAGDRALVHFVTTVHAIVRPTDLTARCGGEEFGLLFPATGLEDAAEVVERLQRELSERRFQFEKASRALSFSAGVTQWRPGESLEALMRRADSGLYEAKKAGKSRVVKVA